MADEFEQAVLCCFRPGVPQGPVLLLCCVSKRFADVRDRATQYIKQLRSSPDAWKFCLERFFTTSIIEVKARIACVPYCADSLQFYCLQALQEIIAQGCPLDRIVSDLRSYDALTPAVQVQLRTVLFSWLSTYLVANPTESLRTCSCSSLCASAHVPVK